MNISQIIDLLGGPRGLSVKLNFSRAAVYNWKKRNEIPGYLVPVLVGFAGTNQELINGIKANSSDLRKVSELLNETFDYSDKERTNELDGDTIRSLEDLL